MKDIVIVANFCRDFSESDNGRFVYLCRELAKENNVELITSDFSHIEKEHRKDIKATETYKITLLRELGYKKNISIRRFLSHFLWGRNVRRYLYQRKRPDVIYCAVPSLTAPLAAARYCKKNRVKYIIDIQDLWPEAFNMVFHVPIISNIIFFPFNYIANTIYKHAHEVIAVSETYTSRALSVNKKCTEGHTVYLGTRLETFDKGVEGKPLVEKTCDEIWIGYCGSLAASYDIPNLLRALKILKDDNIKGLKLVVIGDGAHRKNFENLSKDLEVDTLFTGRLPYDQMCAQLVECDIVVNPIKRGSAASIINKHGDYAASGLPVVNTQESQEYRNLIDEYQMGLNCANEDAYDIAEKLKLLILNESVRLSMGDNARRCALEKFDRERTYKEIVKLI